jgi:hypothetical protein
LSGDDTVNLGDADNGLALISTPVTVVGNALGAGDTINVIDQANPNPETYLVTNTDLSTSTRQIVSFQDFDTLRLFPSFDPNTAVMDVHDADLYTLVISYDSPAAAPPPGGGAGMRLSGDLKVQMLQADDLVVKCFAATADAGGPAAGSAALLTDAMLVDVLTGSAKKLGAQPAMSLDLVWADAALAGMPAATLP